MARLTQLSDQLLTARFLESGLVEYETGQRFLIPEESLDAIGKAFKGAVVTIGHLDNQARASRSALEEKGVGVVLKVQRRSDGWLWADMAIDDTALYTRLVAEHKNGGLDVSCTYDPILDWQEGTYNSTHYDSQILGVSKVFEMALLMGEAPRYSGSKVVIENSAKTPYNKTTALDKPRGDETMSIMKDMKALLAKYEQEHSGSPPQNRGGTDGVLEDIKRLVRREAPQKDTPIRLANEDIIAIGKAVSRELPADITKSFKQGDKTEVIRNEGDETRKERMSESDERVAVANTDTDADSGEDKEGKLVLSNITPDLKDKIMSLISRERDKAAENQADTEKDRLFNSLQQAAATPETAGLTGGIHAVSKLDQLSLGKKLFGQKEGV